MIKNYNFTTNWISKIPIPEHYESYLYIIVIYSGKPKNKYLGYAEHGFNGIYKGSPITHKKEFFEDLGKYEYKVEALDFGEAQNIIYKEKLMLDDIKSNGKWDEYYNESTGGGRKLKNYSKQKEVNGIWDDIKKGNFPIVNVPKEDLVDKNKYRHWQVRKFKKLPAHVKALKDLLNTSDGKWLDEKHRGVLVLENYDGSGKHVRIGSAHIILASQNVDQVTTLKVIFIPENRWKNLSKSQIKGLGQSDNPPNQTPRIETPADETAEWIVETCDEENITPTHISIENKLLEDGFTPKQIDYRVEIAKKWLEDKEKIIGVGEIQKDYDNEDSEDFKELQKKITAFKGKVIIGVAGQLRRLKLDLVQLIIDNPTETKFKIFVKVPVSIGAVAKDEKYDKSESAELRIFADNLQKNFKERDKKKIDIRIEKLDFTKPNPLEV